MVSTPCLVSKHRTGGLGGLTVYHLPARSYLATPHAKMVVWASECCEDSTRMLGAAFNVYSRSIEAKSLHSSLRSVT